MWSLTKRYASLGREFLSPVTPQSLIQEIKLVHKNNQLINNLGLVDVTDEKWCAILSGNETICDYQPLASVYMGHQFGVPVPQLGDGRAILIGEHTTPDGKTWELQLKGAGATPYSRRGDGRAVLRSSIREYLVSHAMNKLGIATTNALAIVTSDDEVYRESKESAAIVMRIAPTFLRFGHFEYFAYHGKLAQLRQLIDFTCHNFFPNIVIGSTDYIAQFLQQVVICTAKTIARWQAIGFVHGVMNTDNMSIIGLTLDYGPYAFIDKFIPNHIYNHSDSEGRYTYQKQPQIAWWNLYRLAESLLALDGVNEEQLQPVLDSFAEYYNHEYQTLMWAKVGVFDYSVTEDKSLLDDILKFLEREQIDWTYFWRKLSFGDKGITQLSSKYPQANFTALYQRIQQCHSNDKIELSIRLKKMRTINPAFILRNHLLQTAIVKAQKNDYSEVAKLFELSDNPYTEILDNEYYYNLPPAWAEHIELSCSS